jgi:hypothetical protein
MCEQCDVLTGVLTELCGEKVANVLMKRAIAELHGKYVFAQKEIGQVMLVTST